MSLFVSQLFNGLQTGSVYALVALGYSMVYGIILLLNFAHGDIIMVGAYTAFYAMTAFHLHPILSVVLAVVTSTLLGVVIEKVAYTPLRSAPRLSLLITAIGISFLLENGAQLLFGADTKSMDTLVPGNVSFGSVTISYTAILTIIVAVIAMVALTLLVQKTKLGKAMRAVSEDMGAAQLMGISLNKTISFTFAVGSALAGIGSVSLCVFPGIAHDGLDARPEGVRRGRSWRHRLDSRCNDRRLCHWSSRSARRGGRSFRLEGRSRVCNSDRGAACKAVRHYGPSGHGKGLMGEVTI